MKKFFTITLAVIAAFMFTACSSKNLDDLIEIPDTDDTADSSETSDQNDTDQGGEMNTDTTDTTDTTDITDTADTSDTTDTTDTTADTNPDTEVTDTDDPDTGDTDADTGDTGADTGDTGADTGDTGADTGDTGADTGDTGADTGDTGADTGDTGADTGDTGADTGDTGADTGDTGADTGDTTDTADSGDSGDTTEPTESQDNCIEITLNTGLSHVKSSSSLSYRYDIFKTTYTPGTGSATTDSFYLKLYGSEYNYSGNHELAGTNWKDDDGYSNSGLFLYVYEDEYCDSYSGSCSHGNTYFQKAGTVNVTDVQINFGTVDSLYAKLTGVVLEQVTINSVGESTPVDKGACLKIINDPTVEYHNY